MDQERIDWIVRTLASAPVSSSASGAPWRPMARRDHLVMSQVGDEVLVYDETTHAIHRLNPTSQAVWSLCDGTRTLATIGQVAGAALGAEVPEAVVRLALRQLAVANLLGGSLPVELREPRQTRRTMLRRLVVAGGVALPVLVSVSAPTAAGVSSNSCEAQGGLGSGAPCTAGSQCCTGHCEGGFCDFFTPPPPPTADTAACGRICSSNGDCGGVCGTCRQVADSPGGPIFACQP
jgi:hypothetical protein